MLKVKLINEAATLNNFKYIDSKDYVPNVPFKLKVQFFDTETDQRIMADSGAKAVAVFQTRQGTDLVVPGTFMFGPDDKSMWNFDISNTYSNDIVGSNVLFKLDFDGSSSDPDLADSDDLRSGFGFAILAKNVFDGEC